MKSVQVTVNLRDGSTKEFVENVNDGSGDSVDLKLLVQSMTSVQSRVNSFLTELVEKERGTTQNKTQNSSQNSDDDDDDDDDDDEEDDDVENSEPPLKQQKT